MAAFRSSYVHSQTSYCGCMLQWYCNPNVHGAFLWKYHSLALANKWKFLIYRQSLCYSVYWPGGLRLNIRFCCYGQLKNRLEKFQANISLGKAPANAFREQEGVYAFLKWRFAFLAHATRICHIQVSKEPWNVETLDKYLTFRSLKLQWQMGRVNSALDLPRCRCWEYGQLPDPSSYLDENGQRMQFRWTGW